MNITDVVQESRATPIMRISSLIEFARSWLPFIVFFTFLLFASYTYAAGSFPAWVPGACLVFIVAILIHLVANFVEAICIAILFSGKFQMKSPEKMRQPHYGE